MIKEILYKWFGIETPPCTGCEAYREQLAIANIEKRQMLESILSFTKPSETGTQPVVNYEELKPRMMTWNVRKQLLEAEDRKKANILAEQKRAEEIAKLEKEVGIEVNSDA